MKKIILYTLLSFLTVSSFAQQKIVSPLDYEKPVVKQVIKSALNKEKIDNLNEALRVQNYAVFFEILNATIKNEDYINYLLAKSPEGHAPIYWLMADYYSTSNPKETHKWYYIAIIMSQQDSAVCLDLTARFATQKIMKLFPEVLSSIRTTPQFINPAMTEVVFYMESMKQRPYPGWACMYGENDYLYPKEKTIKPYLWKEKRDEVFKKFTENYAK